MTVPNEVERLTRNFGWNSRLEGTDPNGVFSVASSEVSGSFSADQMEELNEGDGGWWYETRNQVVISILKKFPVEGVLWDIGSGSGLVTKYVLDHGCSAIGVEPSSRGAQLAMQRGVPSICGILQDLTLPSSSIAGVGMFDVLEHLSDRQGMLREVHRVLKPGGHLYLTLPAIQALWSQFDADAGHHLRYSKRIIKQELKSAGLEVAQLRYFFLLSLPVVFFIRALPFRLGRSQIVSTSEMLRRNVGTAGKVATALELLWSKIGIIGTSLSVVARKP